MASVRARLEAATYSSSDDDDDSNSLAPYSAFNSLPTEDSLEQIRRRTTDINGDPSHYERTNSDVEEKSARLGKLKSYCYKCMDISVTVVVILVIWMVMALPTAFYVHTKLVHTHQVSSLNSSVSSDNDTCTLYNATTECTEHIQHYARCLYDVDSPASKVDVYISGSPNYKELESMLNIFSESWPIREQCLSNIKPLICLYYINICTKTTGIVVKPSVKQCKHVEEVCNKELEEIRSVLPHVVDKYLSECVQTSPLDNKTCIESPLDNTTCSSSLADVNNSKTTCIEGFYWENGSCHPECIGWTPYSIRTKKITDILAILATVVAVVSGVAVLILSCVHHQKMFRYPSIFVVYQTIPTIILATLVIVGFSARRHLFCQSQNLAESYINPSPFCLLTGTVFYYVVLQLLLWWLWHTIAVFWAVTWPFHARKFNTSRNTKYLHIAFALASLVLPVGPVLVILFVPSTPSPASPKYGFTITRAPPFVCTGHNIDVNFWAFIFPISLLLAVGVTLLVFILRTVIKKHFLSKIHKIRVNLNWALELKVLIVLCYYVLLGAAVLTIFTMALTEFQDLVDRVLSLIACPTAGTLASTCNNIKLSNPYPSTVAIVILGFLPTINFIYVVKIKELKNKLKCCQTRRVQYVPKESSRSSRYIPYVVNREPISTTLRHGSLTVHTKTAPLISSLSNNDLRQ